MTQWAAKRLPLHGFQKVRQSYRCHWFAKSPEKRLYFIFDSFHCHYSWMSRSQIVSSLNCRKFAILSDSPIGQTRSLNKPRIHLLLISWVRFLFQGWLRDLSKKFWLFMAWSVKVKSCLLAMHSLARKGLKLWTGLCQGDWNYLRKRISIFTESDWRKTFLSQKPELRLDGTILVQPLIRQKANNKHSASSSRKFR